MMEIELGNYPIGPAKPWQYVGYNTTLSNNLTITGTFPTGLVDGDLVVAVLSARNYNGYVKSLPMDVAGWEVLYTSWSGSEAVDYVCVANYSASLAAPVWTQPYNRYVRVALFGYRAAQWSTVRLEHNNAPMDSAAAVATVTPNSLILNLGITTDTTGAWYRNIGSLSHYTRYNQTSSPSMCVSDADALSMQTVNGIYTNASSGAERNLILVAC